MIFDPGYGETLASDEAKPSRLAFGARSGNPS